MGKLSTVSQKKTKNNKKLKKNSLTVSVRSVWRLYPALEARSVELLAYGIHPIKNATKTSCNSNFFQPPKNSLVNNNAFARMMEYHEAKVITKWLREQNIEI